MLLLAREALPAQARALPRGRYLLLLAMLLLALLAPDFDFVLSRVLTGRARAAHGLFVHSFTAAAVFGVLWGVAAAVLLRLPVLWMALLGAGCYASHVLMDMLTHGRGVALWWPLSEERVSVGPVFFGLRHSEPWNVGAHAITVVTEGAFVALVWLASRQLQRWRARP